MPTQRLINLLDQNKIHYTLIPHSDTYTTAATGAVTHIPGRAIAKTVMVRVNGDPVMSVIPGSRHLDLNALKKELGTTQVQLMSESEFASAFPDCDIGAMPPLGVLYQLPVYVDDHLAQENEIAFNAGSHRELVRLSYKEFERLQHPRVMHIASQTAAERLQGERAGTDVQSFL